MRQGARGACWSCARVSLFKASESTSPATDKVDYEDYQRNHEQQMNQRTRNVQAESQKPKDQQDYKNRPEHRLPLFEHWGRSLPWSAPIGITNDLWLDAIAGRRGISHCPK
jgi:hypothetical protein